MLSIDRSPSAVRTVEFTVDAAEAAAFADVTGHGAADIGRGFAPPLYAARAIGAALSESADLLPADAPVVHAAHDMEIHRPLPLGATATVHCRVLAEGDYGFSYGVQVGFDVHVGGEPATTMTAVFTVGEARRRGRLAPAARPLSPGSMIAETVTELGTALPRRYAAVSGDRNPVHLDDAVARAADLPGVIVHGMATLALTVAGASHCCAEIGTAPVLSLRARMSRPVRPASWLHTAVSRTATPGVFRLHAAVDGTEVLKDVQLAVGTIR